VAAGHAGGGFGRDVALVHRLVRQHRQARDVADGEDVRYVGRHAGIHRQ
jgi:hypothetical protein